MPIMNTDLMTQPTEMPVRKSHAHQSGEKGLYKGTVQSKGNLPCEKRNLPSFLVVKDCHAVDRGESEKKQHGVEENESRDDEPGEVA